VTRLIDLTHPLGLDANVPPALPNPAIDTVRTMASHGRNSSVITLAAHTGTHLDAPWHVSDTGADINSIGLDRLIGPAVIWAFPQTDEPRGIGPEDFEGATPKVERGDAVLISTGWAEHYGTPLYRRRPWLTVDAAIWLREHGVRLVGIDFASPEQRPAGDIPSFDFSVHHELLDHGGRSGGDRRLPGARLRRGLTPSPGRQRHPAGRYHSVTGRSPAPAFDGSSQCSTEDVT